MRRIELFHIGSYIDRSNRQFYALTWSELRENCKYKDKGGKTVYPVAIPEKSPTGKPIDIRSKIELELKDAKELAFMLKKEVRFSRYNRRGR